VTALLPVFVASSELVAVIVIVFGVGRLAGAVYIPFASIVPVLALPPAIEFTDQFTVALGLLLTTAANDSFEPARIATAVGVTVTPLLAPSGNEGEPSLPRRVPSPEQPLNNNNRIAGALQIRFTDMTPIGPRQTLLRSGRAQKAAPSQSKAQLLIRSVGVAAWVP
jgi:hypothetical protein